ncbi:glycosyltransferase family 58 protein [Guyanagaster necrorhizus]|uniref:Dol-P-Man:Man(5)GlcNAc(2)-PP-Dol alpha-1,3-mannosyltransferase n=1 Tax=Guyanagaster necrorhizus TaxID=856835 RepID=A0A9P7W5P4_9AGAR|nr:glycosyltransferase family 58 protein [Guyanagaster necrorhizus MCA 3950]KAG7452622.1 glycosyltransferase family 58 protein [Guyanagaster necrorhizus MCA 3950]
MTTLHLQADRIRSLFLDTRYFWILALLVVASDAILVSLIVHFVPYTEIDWETYMIQVETYIKGQRDYSQISGPTGPLVYPAGHVYIHQFLHFICDFGKNIKLAQYIYSGLYLLSIMLSCAIYRQAGTSNWVVLLLPLSKRLHSIYVLRLFNDCWSVVAMQAAVLAYQLGKDDIGTLFFSAALSVKMSIILYLPGLLVILFKKRGFLYTIQKLLVIFATQVLIAFPFIRDNWREYVQGAFNLSRVFLYKWTVNWRMVSEETFLSPQWKRALLLGHVCTLIAFGWNRWCKRDGGVPQVLLRGLRRPTLPASLISVTAESIAAILFTSNLIGVLFARSLHYQFYCWYAQQLPFLTWKTRYPLVVKLALLVGVEYAWNIFPSTSASSAILFISNSLLLAGLYVSE